MASLYIKDSEMAEQATKFAKRLKTTKTDAVRQAFEALEEKLGPEAQKPDFVEWMKQYRRDNPLPLPTGLKADKAFYDWLSGKRTSMTLFLDASALVAMIADEPEGDDFLSRVRDDDDPLWSAMTEWEAVSALCRSHGYQIERARREVKDIARARPFRRVPIGSDEAEIAVDAYEIYGKGRHPAKLNLGDCFSYACAKTNNAELLYKGNDFAKTDLA